jgi:hypothetical protein
MEIRNISNWWGQKNPAENKAEKETKESNPLIKKVSIKAFENLNEEEDIYDLDVEISEEKPNSPEDTGSSRKRVCSQCACDTAGCVLTNSCRSYCGGTQCLC